MSYIKIVLEIIFLIIVPFLYRHRKTILNECEGYTNPTKKDGYYKILRDSVLKPAYISLLTVYQNFRRSTSKDIKSSDLDSKYRDIHQHLIAIDFLKKKVTLDKLKNELDLIGIHQYIETEIDRRGGGPEQIINVSKWDDAVKESNRLFSHAMKNIHKNKKLDNRNKMLDGLFLCSILLASMIFAISIILDLLSINYKIYNIDCSLFCFCIGLTIFVLSFLFLIGIIRTKRGLEKIYDEATESNV
jgi:hypothetical protein